MIRSNDVAAALVALVMCSHTAGAQGTTQLVSRASDGMPVNSYSGGASASADGRVVAFHSIGTNLVAGDTNGLMDAFVHDRASGVTRRVSVASDGTQADGETWDPRVSGNGRYVTFWCEASNLVAGDTNGVRDVFVHDLQSGTTVRASVSSSGAQANGRSGSPSISFDGRYVVFHSVASNLIPGDTNGAVADVFVRDTLLGTTILVSRSTTGSQVSTGCQGGTISDDGRFVAFTALASDLVPGDANGELDVFVRDTLLATTVLASRTSAGFAGNGESSSACVSGDGRYVAFLSEADDLVAGDTNGDWDVFVHEIATGVTVVATVTSSGAPYVGGLATGAAPSISIDGTRVVFACGDTNLVPGDTNGFVDVFLRDLVAGTTELVSRSTLGIQGGYFSTYPTIAGDGRHVVFESEAHDLVALVTPASRSVYVRDTQGCAPTVAVYCSAGTTTHGCQPSIAAVGTPSASAGSGFTITAGGLDGQEIGFLFYGWRGAQTSAFGGGSGFLCVRSPLRRTGVQASGGTAGACDGQLALDWNQFVAAPTGGGVQIAGGETVWAQAWVRDPLAPKGGSLSGAMWFDVCR